MEISEKIKQRRKYLGLSKRELAEKISVHETSIGKYEQGKVDFPVSKIKKLAKALDVSEIWLLGLDEFDENTIEIEELVERLLKTLTKEGEVTFKGQPIGEYLKVYTFEVLSKIVKLIEDRQTLIKVVKSLNENNPNLYVVESNPEKQHLQAKKDVEELFRFTFENKIL